MGRTALKARMTSATGRARASSSAAVCRGFTLLEVLLVVVILLITSALAVPSFIRSFRGAKLRSAARAVVMSHRYARAMAVLKQTEAAILYDSKMGEIEIVSVKSSAESERNKFLDNRSGLGPAAGAAATDSGAQSIVSEIRRRVPEGVKIERVESRVAKQEKDGLYWVRYYSNGMCDDYDVKLVDENQKRAVVKVDPISGKVGVEYE
jgi:prepilin-type N-terminal cleavage/methylation domain-containing protein